MNANQSFFNYYLIYISISIIPVFHVFFSHNPSSQRSTERITAVRRRLLAHFNVNETDYEVVFTRSATDAIR